MAITPIEAFPDRSDAAFKTRVESFFDTELPTLVTEMNNTAEAMNADDLFGTSSTSYTPNILGAKTFTTQSAKSWMPGQWVTIGYTSDGREYAAGPVQSYSGTSLSVDIKVVSGHSTARTSWKISFSPPIPDLFGEQEVIFSGGNGYGSTNIRVRKYSTIVKNVGTNMTAVNDASLGASVTINVAGVYIARMTEVYGSGSGDFGIGLNITTDSGNSSEAYGSVGSTSGTNRDTVIVGGYFSVGDILRPMGVGGTLNGTSNCKFAVVRAK